MTHFKDDFERYLIQLKSVLFKPQLKTANKIINDYVKNRHKLYKKALKQLEILDKNKWKDFDDSN